ncbi:MAG: DegT/DnrJ/EryC1/StrS family aminotransferase [Actinobacteria bacterium]|nr:DegT/DnrJ/EryC1/StrS family aminotransferase [Actinomycetota bacterium]
MSDKLAIAGGTPVVDTKTIKSWPVITQDDRDAVLRVLDSGIVAGGTAPEAVGLEKDWAAYCGSKYCLTTNSGTAALHMALAAAGIGPGDEVITSAFTFLASASCALHQNAIPRFVDIDPRTYTMDPSKLEAVINERTKAIIPVHIQGIPADMDPILDIAKRHDLVVIEDACQAHGATYKGKKAGTMGLMGAFSLNCLKNLCGGEGGLLISDDEYSIKKASLVRMFGDEVDDERQIRVYNASILGWMYRNQELPAAFARSQLKRLDQFNATRAKNSEYLTEAFKDIPGIIPPYVPEDRTHVYFFYIIRLDPKAAGVDAPPRKFREAVEKAIFKEGIPIGQWQTMPVPAQDLFQTKYGYGKTGFPWTYNEELKKITYNVNDYPEAQKLCEDYTVVHGTHPPNDTDLMAKYVETFQKVFSNLDEVMAHADDDIQAGFSPTLYGAS